jgi:hypothetical protein
MKSPTHLITNVKAYLFRYSFLFLMLASGTTHAQVFEGWPEIGTFSSEEVALKKVAFEPDANAVILFDLGRAMNNDEYNLVTYRRIRMKILNDKGMDQANITIPYYSRDDFEFISNIHAVIATYDKNNVPVITRLDNKSIYFNKVNAYWSEVKFSMPNVKPGSIIDYEYTSTMKSYGGLDEWLFQSDVPTLKSFYKLNILPNTEFAYKVNKLSTIPIKIGKDEPGIVSFEMQNIPSLNDEAFMDARKDNLQRVTFQYAGGRNSKYISSWDDVAKEMLDSDGLGAQLKKSIPGTEEFIKATKAIASETERLQAVHSYVQKRIGWNGINSKFSSDGIKKAWEKQKGTNGEINLIFINLLKEVGIDAVPLLASDRNYMKVDLSYPFLDQFNKVVAYVFLAGKNMVIDASDDYTPLHVAPRSLLNTYAYIIDKKRKGVIYIENTSNSYANHINIFSVLSPEGVLDGSATIISKDYARLERKYDYNKSTPSQFSEKYFLLSSTDLKTDSLVVANIDKDSLPLEQQFTFKQTLNNSGEYAFLNYHYFTGLGKNPFTSTNRFSDINLGYQRKFTVTETVELPANLVVDALPKNITMTTPDTSLLLRRIIHVEGNQLICQLQLEILKTYYEKEEYVYLKEFYKKLYAYLDEQIVLKQRK